MLASTASTACRALLASSALSAAAPPLLPAAAPAALYAAVSRLGNRLDATHKLFTSSSFAAKAAEPALAEPALESKDAMPTEVAMHPGLAREQEEAAATDQELMQAPHGGKVEGSYMLMHPVYSPEYLASVRPTHKPPKTLHDRVGWLAVQALRRTFDFATGYGANMTETKWLARMIYLETVAGVPGMVAGMLRHMRSLRSLRRDNGWIHTLLEEAENERMHLLTFMQLRQPGPLFRAAVLAGQGIFFNGYLLAYILSPKTCHAFVGYLEEEAVHTYTRAIEDMDAGKLEFWRTKPAPEIALKYWRLAPDATMRDLLLNVRADEACHRHVNHVFAGLDYGKDPNPFQPGSVEVP